VSASNYYFLVGSLYVIARPSGHLQISNADIRSQQEDGFLAVEYKIQYSGSSDGAILIVGPRTYVAWKRGEIEAGPTEGTMAYFAIHGFELSTNILYPRPVRSRSLTRGGGVS